MTTDRRLARLAHSRFMEAMDLPSDQRGAFVRSHCGDDPVLMEQVLGLVDAADRAGAFLQVPAFEPPPPEPESIPDAIGNYLVVGVLGSGGMATVYEAIQEQPRRRVALKVLPRTMSGAEHYARFRFESEALARLQHPAIAQIYEAGMTHLGQPNPSPFIAMELVTDALPLIEYVEREGMALGDRLQLFVTICEAVHHGHQQGVIHRDLKSANVLVDGAGRPKIIDFGIARATGARGESLTAAMGARPILGTLSAMSPEQCDPAREVDIRTDVYSLGVLLYQLVAGRRPHDLAGKSIPEAIRVVCEVDPLPPSRFLPAAAGDLDAIVGMAMDKDRQRRYVSAAALGDDVRRVLTQQPITARKATALVHLRKFVRRNRSLTVASLVALVLLMAGVGLTARLAVVESRARRAAELRERQLERVTEFQASLLRDIDVTEMGDRLRQALMESLAGTAPGAETGFDPPGDLRRLTDQVNFTSLAVRTLNESVIQRYGDSIRREFSDEPVLQSQLLQQLAGTMNTLGLISEAEPVLREALEIRRHALGPDHEDTLLTLHSLGSLLTTLGRYDEAVGCLREAHAGRGKLLGPDNRMTLRTATSLGGALRLQGNLDEAERVWSDALRDQRRVLGDEDPETLRNLNNLGVVFASQGRLDEAESCWRELLQRRRRVLGDDHPDTRGTLGNLCSLLQERGDVDEVLQLQPLVERSLAADRLQFGDRHPTTLMTMGQLADLLLGTGYPAVAMKLQRECLAGREASLGAEHPATLLTMAALATSHLAVGETSEAAELAAKALEIQRRELGVRHPETIESISLLSRIARKSGELDKALALSSEALEFGRQSMPSSHWRLGALLSAHGAVLLDLNRPDDARSILAEALAALRLALGDNHPLTREAADRLAACASSADVPISRPAAAGSPGAN